MHYFLYTVVKCRTLEFCLFNDSVPVSAWTFKYFKVPLRLAEGEDCAQTGRRGRNKRRNNRESEPERERGRWMRWKYYDPSLCIMCHRIIVWQWWELICITLRIPLLREWSRWAVKAIRNFPPTPNVSRNTSPRYDSQMGIPRVVNPAATVDPGLSTFMWIELTG